MSAYTIPTALLLDDLIEASHEVLERFKPQTEEERRAWQRLNGVLIRLLRHRIREGDGHVSYLLRQSQAFTSGS